MKAIKKSISNEKLFDDSNIYNRNAKNSLYQYNNAYNKKFIESMRRKKNMILHPISSTEFKRKSLNINKKYIPTILGFLEKRNDSSNL